VHQSHGALISAGYLNRREPLRGRSPGHRPSEGALRDVGQSPQSLDANLSPECRVPALKLYDLAPLPRVRAALKQKRPVKVLALGPPSPSARGGGTGLAPYPVRLEHELEKVLPGVDVTVQGRTLPGDITAQAVGTIMNIASETEPELIVWQVGIDDALAQAEVAPFAAALDEILAWFRSHEIDAVLVEPPYTKAMATDAHFTDLIATIRARARANEVPLIRRSAAMRFLFEQRTDPAQSSFGLQTLGYHCTAEHVAHVVMLSLNGAATPR
jgi:acyl-CoA thioesterase I